MEEKSDINKISKSNPIACIPDLSTMVYPRAALTEGDQLMSSPPVSLVSS